MATTSGSVGRTQLDVTTAIEHAFRRCGKLASTISSELQQSALENLNFLLSDLANRGLSLWCIRKSVLGVSAGKAVYALEEGTVDVLGCNYRTKTDLTGSTVSGAGYQGLNLGTSETAAIVNAAIMFTAVTTPTLVLESSTDGAAWTQRQAFSIPVSLPAETWICVDLDNSVDVQYWRIRETGGTLPTVSRIAFSTDPYEVPMAKVNRDDYQSLPSKITTGGKSLEYWFDKQIAPQIWVWPVNDAYVDQVVVWNQRHIQDVVAYTDLVEVPQRWHQFILFSLAMSCALELPAGELPPGRFELLKTETAERLLQAEDSESDGSPIRLQPNIAGYTA